MAQFGNKDNLAKGQAVLISQNIPNTVVDGWAHRSITRDVSWGIPMPADLNLPADVFTIAELGRPIPSGHEIGKQQSYFPKGAEEQKVSAT